MSATEKTAARRKAARAKVTGETPAVETETPAVEPEPETKTPRLVETPLDEQTAAWVAQHARPAVAPCLCGCGETTKGRFFPGHDAILKARLNRTDSDSARQALATFGW